MLPRDIFGFGFATALLRSTGSRRQRDGTDCYGAFRSEPTEGGDRAAQGRPCRQRKGHPRPQGRHRAGGGRVWTADGATESLRQTPTVCVYSSSPKSFDTSTLQLRFVREAWNQAFTFQLWVRRVFMQMRLTTV